MKMPFTESIEFKDIEYSYSNDTNCVLQNCNLKINKGDKIGLIGDTGSGKSTFIDILQVQ